MSERNDDSRLGNRANSQSSERQDRAAQDRPVTQDRSVSREERLNIFRNAMFQSALPTIPEIPGYKICWLTTANPRDPIAQRQMLGYEPIKAKAVPGFELATIK